MATQPQAPFWAPRPPDDSCWLGMPAPQQPGAIRLLTRQKFFGAGGQVPTKRWSPFFVDEPAVTWMPAFQNGPVRVTLTQAKFFGQNGQVPTKNWAIVTTFNDEALWGEEAPRSSQTIRPLLTAAGQVKSKQWLFGYDDAAFWQGVPQRSVAITFPTAAPFKPLQWLFGYDDATVWAPTPKTLNSSAIQILSSGGKPFSRQWRYDLDDPTWYWSFPYNSGLGVGPKPFSNVQWRFGIDDPTWAWSFQYNQIINVVPPFNFTGPARAPMYVPKPPEDPTWQFKATFNLSSTLPTGPPFIFNASAQFTVDDPAVWSGNQMVYNNIAVTAQFTPGPISVSFTGPPDDIAWQWSPLSKSINLVISVAQNPFIPRVWRHVGDDIPWQWTMPEKPIVLVTVASPFIHPWAFNFIASEEPWSPTIPRSNTLVQLNFKPFFLPNYGALHYDVLADVWTGKGYYNESLYPGASIIVVGVTFQDPPFFGNMGKMMNN